MNSLEALVKYQADQIRENLQRVGNQIDDLKHAVNNLPPEPLGSGGNFGEVKANITLALRHVEDARMRMGKAIQHSGDGISKYDKSPT